MRTHVARSQSLRVTRLDAALLPGLVRKPVAAAGQEPASQQSVQPEMLGQSQADADRSRPAASAATPRPTAPPCIRRGRCAWGASIATQENAEIAAPPGSTQGSAPYEQAKLQAHPRARFAEDERSSANPVRPYTRWLKEDLAIYPIRESRRLARGGENMRVVRLSCQRSPAGAYQHDVARSDAMGGSAL